MIIVGEHAVIYHASAVAVPLSGMRLTLCAKHNSDPGVRENISETMRLVVHDALDLLAIKNFPYSVTGSSNIILGAGLGGSAAFCVGIIRVICASSGRTISKAETARLANILEARFHGTPSGIDSCVVAHEQPLLFRRDAEPELIVPGKQFHFAIVESGTRTATRTMVRRVRPFFVNHEGNSRVQRFNRLARLAHTGLSRGDESILAQAIRAADQELDAIGLVPDVLRSYIETCIASGALAAKVTGAGGGGCILALLPAKKRRDIMANLQRACGSNSVYEVII